MLCPGPLYAVVWFDRCRSRVAHGHILRLLSTYRLGRRGKNCDDRECGLATQPTLGWSRGYACIFQGLTKRNVFL
jgi:hypothetical protein